MTTESYNLVDKPWIPVTLVPDFRGGAEGGPAPRVSLREAFEYGDQILDLRCYPHERIALMRLLICIAQRALNGPANEAEWQTCRTEIPAKAVAYLEKYRDCFNLFGDGPRFLQAQGLMPLKKDYKPVSVDKLSLVAAAGNTPTWQDNGGGSKRRWSPHDLALMLLSYQICSPGGLVGVCLWNAKPTGKDKSSHHALGARDSAVHGYLLGSSLLEHIHLNLLCRDRLDAAAAKQDDPWGAPVWENPPAGPVEKPIRPYLDRLVPFSRAVWLYDDCKTMLLANGLRYDFYPEGPRDPSLTIILRDKEQAVLIARADRALWRELHALASLGRDGASGPLALSHWPTFPKTISLWAGAVLTNGNNDARVRGFIESIFNLPKRFILMADESQGSTPNLLYEQGVKLATSWASNLQSAIRKYRELLGDNDQGRGICYQAATRYWTALEQKAEPVLLRGVAVEPEGYQGGDVEAWLRDSAWGKEVRRAARDAYDFACPHATPKQLRAYAEGLKALFGGEKASNSKDDEAGNEDSGDEVMDET